MNPETTITVLLHPKSKGKGTPWPNRPRVTVWVFDGEVLGGPRDGALVSVAIDHRMVADIASALRMAGADPSKEKPDRILIQCETWQLL